MKQEEALKIVTRFFDVDDIGKVPLVSKGDANNILGFKGGRNGVYSSIERLIKSRKLDIEKLDTGSVRIKTESLINYLSKAE